MIYGLDNDLFPCGAEGCVAEPDGTYQLELPAGRYLVDVAQFTDAAPDVTWLVQPQVTLDRDLTVVLDGRKAKPVRTTVQRSSVEPALIDVGYEWIEGTAGGVKTFAIPEQFGDLYTAHLGPKAPPEMISHVNSQWAEPGGDGSFANSPYFDGLLDVARGGFFTGLDRTVSDSELARLTSRHARQQPGRVAERHMTPAADNPDVWSRSLQHDLPSQVTSFLEPGTPWQTGLSERLPEDEPWETRASLSSADKVYEAGKSYTDQWNSAVFGPTWPVKQPVPAVGRRLDQIRAILPMFGDGAGHPGSSAVDVATTTLSLDGETIAESTLPGSIPALVDVPPEQSTYRLETSVRRSSFSEFSPSIEAAWTFTSGHVAGDEPLALPLSTIRFSPKVDEFNRNHEGRTAQVPVTVEAQPGSTAGEPELAVDVSVDDGATWSEAVLTRTGERQWVATVETPQDAAFVSLRAKATAADGTSVEQTILRAYAVGS